jgi:P27 family predicted phage terminase small subunit
VANPRQPIELVQLRGAKHLTKQEIEDRQAREIKPVTDDISPPDYLTKKQKETFCKLADQLKKLKIMGETDVDALARYVIADEMYIATTKAMRSAKVKSDPVQFMAWAKVQDNYFKQCRSCANDLGLTISSRCKIVIPQPAEAPKTNKFEKFEKRQAAGE